MPSWRCVTVTAIRRGGYWIFSVDDLYVAPVVALCFLCHELLRVGEVIGQQDFDCDLVVFINDGVAGHQGTGLYWVAASTQRVIAMLTVRHSGVVVITVRVDFVTRPLTFTLPMRRPTG